MFLNSYGFKPKIIPKFFLSVNGVTMQENEKNMFKSQLLYYFIIKQRKSGIE